MKDNHEIIAQALFDSLYSRLQAEMEENPIQHTVSPEFERKMKKLIEKQKKTYYPLICTTGRRAACIGAALLIAASSAISVKAVRGKIAEFFSIAVENGMDHIYVKYDSSADYPKTIEREFIADIPEGFVLNNDWYNKLSVFLNVRYEKDDKYIYISQYTVNAQRGLLIDNETHKKEVYTDEDETTYTIYWDENDTTEVLWEKYGYLFYLTSNLDKNQVLEICKNIRLE